MPLYVISVVVSDLGRREWVRLPLMQLERVESTFLLYHMRASRTKAKKTARKKILILASLRVQSDATAKGAAIRATATSAALIAASRGQTRLLSETFRAFYKASNASICYFGLPRVDN